MAAAWRCRGALLMAVWAAATAASRGPVPARPKHVLAVLVDDLGWADIGPNRAVATPEVSTPTIDALVAEGVHYSLQAASSRGKREEIGRGNEGSALQARKRKRRARASWLTWLQLCGRRSPHAAHRLQGKRFMLLTPPHTSSHLLTPLRGA